MKNYDELTNDLLERRDRYVADQKKKRKRVMGVATSLCCICLVAVIGFGVWQTGVFQNPSRISATGESGATIPTLSPEASADSGTALGETEGAKPTEPAVITGDNQQKGGYSETTNGFCEFWWKNKLIMFGDLYWAIDENPGAVFSVLATYRPTTANITSFVYEGKTLAEWAVDAENERMLPDKMTELLKLGDELKYGTTLYETGTPDGIKWDRAWYEDRVAFFGDLLDKYIVDGEFLRSTLETDIAALQSINVTMPDGTTTTITYGDTSARTQYARAYSAYLETVLPAAAAQLSAVGISCEQAPYRMDALTFSVTAEQLENLPLEDLASWRFSLNSGNLKGSTDFVTTDDTEPQVVN